MEELHILLVVLEIIKTILEMVDGKVVQRVKRWIEEQRRS
jgi:hypothetical protein